METPLPDQPADAAGRVDSSAVLVSEGPLTLMTHPSFSPVASSPSDYPRGGYGWLVHAMRHITQEPDLTVGSLRNSSYEGVVNYLLTLLDDDPDAYASEAPGVPPNCYKALRLAATEQLKLYRRPPPGGPSQSPGGASLWAAAVASAPGVNKHRPSHGLHSPRCLHGRTSTPSPIGPTTCCLASFARTAFCLPLY